MDRKLEIHVHLLPTLIPPGSLHGGVAVVIDVLRASSVMVRALASGCESVIPCAEIEDAITVARTFPPGKSFLGGERGGLPIPGFDLGNSPDDYTPEVCQGRTLVMTTTNGTRAILASVEAERVLIAAFTNFSATREELSLEFLKAHGRPVHFVCAGLKGQVSLEDSLLAGAFVQSLRQRHEGAVFANDSAMIAMSVWADAVQELAKPPRGSGPVATPSWVRKTVGDVEHAELVPLLRAGQGGQNVKRIGLAKDFEHVAKRDRYTLVAQLQRDPLRIVTADEPQRPSETL
jgi:2-phosphosulfolactate phosphatase